MEKRIIAVGVIKKGNTYLVGKKPANKGPYPNTWHILGGGIHIGEEQLEEGLRREIREEAGIEIGNIRAVGFDEDTQPNKAGIMTYYIFLDFTAEYKSGILTPGDDIEEVAWVAQSDLAALLLNPPTRKLLKKLAILQDL